MAPLFDSFGGKQEGGPAELLDPSALLGDTWNGGIGRRPWRPCRPCAGREAEEGKSTQEREGRRAAAGELIPSRSFGGGGHHLARIDGRRGARQLPGCLRKRTSWGGGLGRCRAASYCAKAADKREIREDLGRTRPGEKEMDFFLYTLFYFLFSSFKHFIVVCKHLLIQTLSKKINIYKGLQKLY
jgi:hypothetical protein